MSLTSILNTGTYQISLNTTSVECAAPVHSNNFQTNQGICEVSHVTKNTVQ
jgi:hypothetical protein